MTPRFLNRYTDMRDVSRQMLDAARAGDWDRLLALEAARGSIEEELRQADIGVWTSVTGQEKATLIREILNLDEQVRPLVETGMKELRSRVSSVGTAKKLNKAYGAA